ncbi:hypothetical protein ABZ619_41585 [Streptomyces sp. NPDC007851]|uniref:hypothetical protein n=1 Tax=Streptomyces sp. NPDC007851 TaxID=3155008 RepID=UPI00340102F8
MTTALVAPETPVTPGSGRRTASVPAFGARQLALRTPMMVLGLLCLAYAGHQPAGRDECMDAYPVLHDADRATQGGPMPLSASPCRRACTGPSCRTGGVASRSSALSVVPFAVGVGLVAGATAAVSRCSQVSVRYIRSVSWVVKPRRS